MDKWLYIFLKKVVPEFFFFFERNGRLSLIEQDGLTPFLNSPPPFLPRQLDGY